MTHSASHKIPSRKVNSALSTSQDPTCALKQVVVKMMVMVIVRMVITADGEYCQGRNESLQGLSNSLSAEQRASCEEQSLVLRNICETNETTAQTHPYLTSELECVTISPSPKVFMTDTVRVQPSGKKLVVLMQICLAQVQNHV